MKKILWVVNVPLPEVSELMGEVPQPFGGWLISLSKSIANLKGNELHIAFPSFTDQDAIYRGEEIIYHCVKSSRFDILKKNESKWLDLIEVVKPDLVNVFGTEYKHSSIVTRICRDLNIPSVVTIQGMPTFIAYHTRAGLGIRPYLGFTLRNLLLGDSVYGMKKKFEQVGKFEKRALLYSGNAIGRTEWDKACVKILNPHINYYHCEETLRESFMDGDWDINNVETHSIFMSQGQYSIKGLHHAIHALPEVLLEYPNTKMYISGVDITDQTTFRKKLLNQYYYKYIKRLISDLKLTNYIVFTGPLSEVNMKERYLKSHVFLSASSIENSPNSVGEALILGVPTISSYVGGVPQMITNNFNGLLYQSDAPYLISSKILKIFNDNKLALKLSTNAKQETSALTADDISLKLDGIYTDLLTEKPDRS